MRLMAIGATFFELFIGMEDGLIKDGLIDVHPRTVESGMPSLRIGIHLRCAFLPFRPPHDWILSDASELRTKERTLIE